MVSINKKIDLQKAQLEKISDVCETDVKVDTSGRWKTLFSILLHGSLPVDYSKAYADIADPDYLFIRHAGTDRQFNRFLKRIKEKYPTCRIVVEIPTYPYLKEVLRESFVNWLLLPQELFYRRKLKKYVDRFLIYSGYDEVCGVKTIATMNGSDVRSSRPATEPHGEEIRIIAVAHMQAYDGYERLIDSVDRYVKSGGDRKVRVMLVGDGPELEKYRQLVEKKGLTDLITLYGRKTGAELEELYACADIGVDVLGCYKKGMEVSPSLKSKEYIAHGLPVMGGCEIDVFLKYDFPYFLKVPNDASAIDMNTILDFYDKVYAGKEKREIAERIYAYALKHVDISGTMKPLLDYLEGTKH